ncbi:MAG: hypothetical protein JWN78_2489 [Bacteroidota bacterium]|nr:hypothetical protein [Bacteroidota bacterium]
MKTKNKFTEDKKNDFQQTKEKEEMNKILLLQLDKLSTEACEYFGFKKPKPRKDKNNLQLLDSMETYFYVRNKAIFFYEGDTPIETNTHPILTLVIGYDKINWIIIDVTQNGSYNSEKKVLCIRTFYDFIDFVGETSYLLNANLKLEIINSRDAINPFLREDLVEKERQLQTNMNDLSSN